MNAHRVIVRRRQHVTNDTIHVKKIAGAAQDHQEDALPIVRENDHVQRNATHVAKNLVLLLLPNAVTDLGQEIVNPVLVQWKRRSRAPLPHVRSHHRLDASVRQHVTPILLKMDMTKRVQFPKIPEIHLPQRLYQTNVVCHIVAAVAEGFHRTVSLSHVHHNRACHDHVLVLVHALEHVLDRALDRDHEHVLGLDHVHTHARDRYVLDRPVVDPASLVPDLVHALVPVHPIFLTTNAIISVHVLGRLVVPVLMELRKTISN